MDNTWELLNIVERTIDSAFQGKQMLNMYEYLKSIKATKRDATEFIDSCLGKPEARKIKDYLYSILEDAWKYEQEKRPGRRRKASK